MQNRAIPMPLVALIHSTCPSLQADTMRSCNELFRVLRLHSTSSAAEQQVLAAALTGHPMTPRAWRTAVSALPALVELIRQPSCSSAAVLEQAAHALNSIRDFEHMDSEQVREASADVIASTVQLLQHDAEVWVQSTAGTVLRELSGHPGNQVRMIAASVVDRLVDLLKSSSPDAQAVAASALASISNNSLEGAECIAAAGAGLVLIQLLDPCCSGGEAATEQPSKVQILSSLHSNVLAVLTNLAGQVAPSRSTLFTAGAFPRLVEMLWSDCEELQHMAAGALGNLAVGSPENQARVAAAGAIAPLVKLLASGSEAVQVRGGGRMVQPTIKVDDSYQLGVDSWGGGALWVQWAGMERLSYRCCTNTLTTG